MKINVKATNLDLTPSLNIYIEKKLMPLAKFIKSFDVMGEVEIWVEVARTTKHHHKGQVFRAEADLRLPGRILRAEEELPDLRVAIDAVKDKIRLEIEKYKTWALKKGRRDAPKSHAQK